MKKKYKSRNRCETRTAETQELLKRKSQKEEKMLRTVKQKKQKEQGLMSSGDRNK